MDYPALFETLHNCGFHEALPDGCDFMDGVAFQVLIRPASRGIMHGMAVSVTRESLMKNPSMLAERISLVAKMLVFGEVKNAIYNTDTNSFDAEKLTEYRRQLGFDVPKLTDHSESA